MIPFYRYQLSASQQSAVNAYRINVTGLSCMAEPTLVSAIWQSAEQGDLSSFPDDVLPDTESALLMDEFFNAICNCTTEEAQDALSDEPEHLWFDALHDLIENCDVCPFAGSVRFFNQWLDSSEVAQRSVATRIKTWFDVDIDDTLKDVLLPAMLAAQTNKRVF